MAQNIYDDPKFFDGYSRLVRSVEGLDGAPEWPALRAMLPEVRGRRIVDLGCGFGWFCRWAREQGASRVLGLDLSQKMLWQAREATADERIAYQRADLEALDLPDGRFDLAYSSLAFHYVENAARLYAQIHRALAPGGRLVFSTEHPIYMATPSPEWSVDRQGSKAWPVNRYSAEGPRTTDWLAEGVVKHHRTLGTTLNLLIAAGFRIEQVVEFCPSAEQIAERAALAEEAERPMFLLVSASR